MDYVMFERQTVIDMQRKSDLSDLVLLTLPILMIHLSIIFSDNYIIQSKRPFLINSKMYLFYQSVILLMP